MSERMGAMTHSNTWVATMRFDPHDWAKYRDEYVNSCKWAVLGETIEGDRMVVRMAKKNLVVDSGVENALHFQFGTGSPTAAISVGVDDGTANPVAGTSSSTAGSTNRRFVLFDATPTVGVLTRTAEGTFDNTNVSFVIKRLMLSRAAAGTTDAANDLIAMTNVFTHDNTPFPTWQTTYSLVYTGAGS